MHLEGNTLMKMANAVINFFKGNLVNMLRETLETEMTNQLRSASESISSKYGAVY